MPSFCVPGLSNPVCDVANLLGSATKAVAGSAFQGVVDAFTQGLADVVKALMTFWIHTPDPDVSSSSAVITSLTGLTRPLVAFAAVLGLVVGGVRLAWQARGDQVQPVLRGLLLMTVVTAAGATIIEVLLTGFDSMARWVLDSGFDGRSVGQRLALLGTLPSGVGGGLIFLLAFFGMLASVVQVGVMVVRGAILAMLVGLLPVAAASAITEVGYEWFKRLAGWIASFTVYKLVAAVVYAAAFVLIGDATDLIGVVSGFALIIVAILALPALLRLLPPSAAAMGGGGGGALAGLATAGATGAVLLAGRGGGSGAASAGTASPGLERDPGPTGSQPAAGSGRAASPSGGGASPTGAPPVPGAQPGAGGGAGASAGAGTGATGAAGATGPAGTAVAAAGQAAAAAKQAATGAVGEGGTS